MRNWLIVGVILLGTASRAFSQDQQLGARAKAMGGSYTAFEDDPVSIWLNPAGTATQNNSLSICYQTYVTYPLQERPIANTNQVVSTARAQTTFVDPVFLPAYLGMVFQLGDASLPMAVGICYASPYHLNYSFVRVTDPLQQTGSPNTNIDQSLDRIRFSYSLDYRLSEPGTSTWFTHLSVGAGLDLAYEHWVLVSDIKSATDSSTGFGGGAGVLLGLYDNGDDLKVNLGAAYQSSVHWKFNLGPNLFPEFEMPQQVNAGLSAYLLHDYPFRMTIDFQWIEWSKTAAVPLFPNEKSFRDAYNYSVGFEYRVKLNPTVSLYPRAGYRRFDAPWANKDQLPMTSNFQLVLDTKGSTFNVATMGVGLSWANVEGKVRSLDLAADFGGDSYGFSAGFTYEF